MKKGILLAIWAISICFIANGQEKQSFVKFYTHVAVGTYNSNTKLIVWHNEAEATNVVTFFVDGTNNVSLHTASGSVWEYTVEEWEVIDEENQVIAGKSVSVTNGREYLILFSYLNGETMITSRASGETFVLFKKPIKIDDQ